MITSSRFMLTYRKTFQSRLTIPSRPAELWPGELPSESTDRDGSDRSRSNDNFQFDVRFLSGYDRARPSFVGLSAHIVMDWFSTSLPKFEAIPVWPVTRHPFHKLGQDLYREDKASSVSDSAVSPSCSYPLGTCEILELYRFTILILYQRFHLSSVPITIHLIWFIRLIR